MSNRPNYRAMYGDMIEQRNAARERVTLLESDIVNYWQPENTAAIARAETAEAENEQLTRELGHEIDERQGFLTHIGLAVGLIYDDDTTQYDMAARIVAAIAALRAQVEGQGWRAWWSQRLTIDELIDYDDFPLDETIMAKVFVTSDGLKPIYVIHEWQPLPAPPDAQVT